MSGSVPALYLSAVHSEHHYMRLDRIHSIVYTLVRKLCEPDAAPRDEYEGRKLDLELGRLEGTKSTYILKRLLKMKENRPIRLIMPAAAQ